MTDIREDIKAALKKCGQTPNFKAAATELLQTLGYSSERTLELDGSPTQFMNEYPPPPPRDKQRSQGEVRFKDATKSVHIIFQYTEEEATKTSRDTIEGSTFNAGNYQSFLFVAVELKPGEYARGRYAEFTREINKCFSMPVVALFRVPSKPEGARLTLAFVGRRPSKKDDNRDVLQKVSLLREIECTKPHRGHLDILAELSLKERMKWIDANKKPKNFKGLLDAWINQLDTDALNKRFYNDLFGWFERARAEIQFPENLHKKREDWIIRLITRLLFVWFIKEKGLVDDKLFIKGHIKTLLKNKDLDDDSYYRVVLQNLFFATLNTPIKNRGFSKKNHKSHRDFSLYRYKDEIEAEPAADALLDLFVKTPFINGGLFDCLDDYDSPTSAKNSGRKGGGERTDYFSDVHGKELSLPNRLFFDGSGLLTTFNRYKFTVEENTPIEQEVALDPELLGQVFENLLAAYNPETRENVRKQTGSYYTPRKIVDYMVGQSLMSYLEEKTQPEDGDTKYWQEKLDYLLDYHDAFNDADKLFQENERKSIVRAISELRTLDPAVGSGAFPMGILHRLNLVLDRLDPKNEEWHALQKERAQKDAGKVFNDPLDKKAVREKRLNEINETFTRYSSGFGRKLFLIQNSIFGADIQPVACQITKLRFFISLAIEQEAGKDKKNNYGIKPLPNLETRFVAADTLIRIDKPKQVELQAPEAEVLELKLKQNREQYFNAVSRTAKLHCRDEDQRLRKELATALKAGGWEEQGATRVAEWDLYDQNAAADWFDPAWMFGIPDGFDIVIGNPPYVPLQRDGGQLGSKYASQKFGSFARTGDVYMLFYERGLTLCRQNGALMFITSNSWLRAKYGARLRSVLTRHNPRLLINMGKDVFANVSVDANILFIENRANQNELQASDLNMSSEFSPSEWHHIVPENTKAWTILSAPEEGLRAKIEQAGTQIKDWNVNIHYGIKSGCDGAFIIDDVTKNHLCAANPISIDIIKPTIRGKNIRRYSYQSANEWVIVIPQGWTNANKKGTLPEQFFHATLPAIYDHLKATGKQQGKGKGLYERTAMGDYWWELRPCAYYSEFEKEKLLWIQLVNRGRFTYDDKKLNPVESVFSMAGEDIKYLLAVLNSHLINWQMRHIAPTSGMGVPQWKKTYVEQLPIPKISKTEQRPFIELAEKITAAKAANPDADTSGWEAEVDRLVYALYGLTESEIKIIEATG